MAASVAKTAETMRRACTGPAAWRNVPHWVAAGKSKLVTMNMIKTDDDERPQCEATALPGQGEQADHGHRHSKQYEHVEQVVCEAG